MPLAPQRWMTDEEEAAFAAALNDPTRIKTVQEAEAVLKTLEAEIAAIAARLEMYEARRRQSLPPERTKAWASRAEHAALQLRTQRKLILLRRRQLRTHEAVQRTLEQAGIVPPDATEGDEVKRAWTAQQLAVAARAAEELAKSEADLLARAQIHLVTVEAKKNVVVNRLFVEAARERFPTEEFSALWAEARARYQALLPRPPSSPRPAEGLDGLV